MVSHGRLDCYDKQAVFFNKFECIKEYDIIIYDNSGATEEQIKVHTKDFNADVRIICQRPNQGYFLGQLNALNECYDLLKDYTYVIHHSWDCFFVKDGYLNDWLINFKVHHRGGSPLQSILLRLSCSSALSNSIYYVLWYRRFCF